MYQETPETMKLSFITLPPSWLQPKSKYPNTQFWSGAQVRSRDTA